MQLDIKEKREKPIAFYYGRRRRSRSLELNCEGEAVVIYPSSFVLAIAIAPIMMTIET